MPDETLPERVYAMIVQSPWLLPDHYNLIWMIPTAAVIMLFPLFIVSYLIERIVVSKRLMISDRSKIRSGVYWGNVASYTCLALFWILSMY